MYVLLTWPGRGHCLHASMAAVNAINIMQTCVGRQHGEYTDADTACYCFCFTCQEIWELNPSMHQHQLWEILAKVLPT